MNAKCLEDGQNLTDFGGLFPSFEFYDESQTRAGGQGERLLRHAEALARLADQPANVLWRVFQVLDPIQQSYRTGIL